MFSLLQRNFSWNCPPVETEKTVCAVDVLFCDQVEEVDDCSYPTNTTEDISIADCSLVADSEQTECRSELLEDNLELEDTTQDKITEEVVENVFTPGEEEIILVCDESGEYMLPDFEELQSDFMLVSSFQEDEWAEEPVPENTFENNLNPFDALISNLQNTIPEEWIISPTRKNVRLTLLSHFENIVPKFPGIFCRGIFPGISSGRLGKYGKIRENMGK
ncbi:DNA-directed RNA polymerase subunit beta' [Frankliniella fusca]|uniref:DNA-directed RNA polymerase subunit beta n=1 Tax=Frankliniella fusca TaxID=407009 RepID=A0AAE1HHB9_9NEOP|nr:DNA-directed RNA polymerase subunit beta' [Frankliniella fusca]